MESDPVNFVDPSGLSAADIGLVVLKNVAGGVDAFTGGFTGWVAENINSMVYSDAVATATTATLENTLTAQAVEVFDYVNPKGWVKKAGKKAIKAGKKALAKKSVKKQTPPKKADASGKKDGIVVKLKGCFKPGKTLKKGFKKRHPSGKTPEGRTLDEEFSRQLKNQEEGINQMSPEDLIEGITKYKGVRNAKDASKVKQKYRDGLFGKKWRATGDKALANRYADNAAKQMDVLHNPDGHLGGTDSFDVSTPEKLDKHIGDKGVNRSLGSQGKHKQEELLKEAQAAQKRGDKKMNIKLERCK